MTALRTSCLAILAVAFALFIPESVSAQLSGGEGCSYCLSPTSCIEEDGNGPGDSTCFHDFWTDECTEELHSCETMQTFMPTLPEEDKLDITAPNGGKITLARVAKDTFANWRSCDGLPSLAVRDMGGEVFYLLPETELSELPTYQEWADTRTVQLQE